MQILATTYAAAAGVGLLLGVIHLMVLTRLKDRPEHLFAALMGFSAGVMALSESSYLGEPSLNGYRIAMEVQNVSVAVMLISMTWFARLRLKAGRSWLAWSITALWTTLATISVLGPGNIAFLSIDGLTTMATAWGETYAVPYGRIHPLKVLTDLTSLAIVLFVVDASLSAARSGRRRAALGVGGPILFFIVVAGVHTPLVDAGYLETPYLISLVFVAITLSLALGLVDEVAEAAVLSKQLRLQRQRWQRLLDVIELAVIQTSPGGTIIYVNPYLERLLERRSRDVIGRAVWSLAPQPDSSEVRELLTGAVTWSSRSRVQRRIVTASGAERDLVWFSVALQDERGEPDGLISIGHDVTDQLRTEAEHNATRKENERLARVLTLGELASTFAHELSQPIAAVLSNAQTLEIMRKRDGAQTDDADEILGDILRDTRRARDLMQKVREFMFNEEPKLASFDLATAIAHVVEMLLPEAERKSVRLTADGSAGPVPVSASLLELQQVLMNVVLNAIQAAAGATDGRVEVSYSGDPDGRVMIAVDDGGPGLDAAMREAVFHPLVTSKSNGNGIGLAVAKRIVERHKGTIVVKESSLGGARFEMVLPIGLPQRMAVNG